MESIFFSIYPTSPNFVTNYICIETAKMVKEIKLQMTKNVPNAAQGLKNA